MDISVIVPLYNASPFLPNLLGRLEKQTFNPTRFEVILVDDLSTDNTRQLATDLVQKSALTIQFIERTTNGGVSAARNSGWQAARARLNVFIDQDCLPDENWLWEHYRAHQELGAGYCVAGRIEWATEFKDNPASEYYKSGYFPAWQHYRPGGPNFDFFITSNASVARAGLEQVGGFDERFRHNYDDIVCGYRLEQAGYKLSLCSEALVYHARHLPVAEMLRRCRVAGREMLRFIVHYPELIDHFFTLNPAEAFDWGWRIPSFGGLLARTLDRLTVSEIHQLEPFLTTAAAYIKEHPLPIQKDKLYLDNLQAAQRYQQAATKARWLETAYKFAATKNQAGWGAKMQRLWSSIRQTQPANFASELLLSVLASAPNLQQPEQPAELLLNYTREQDLNSQMRHQFPALYGFYFRTQNQPPVSEDLYMLYDSLKEYALSEGVLEGLSQFYQIEQPQQLENHPLFGRWQTEWADRREAQLTAQLQQMQTGQAELDAYVQKLEKTLLSLLFYLF